MKSYFGYILCWEFQAMKSYFGYQCQTHTWHALNYKQAHSQQDCYIDLKSKQELHSKINKLKVIYSPKEHKSVHQIKLTTVIFKKSTLAICWTVDDFTP